MNLYLAAAEDARRIGAIHSSTLPGKTPCFLSSYYYSKFTASKKENASWLGCYDKLRPCNWILDSGLFTMMFGAGKGIKRSSEELRKYTLDYIRYLKEIEYGHYCVEMDVHKILGLKELAEFRGIFEDKWDVNRTIFVWHIEEGIEGLINLANRYPYIAISIPELRILAQKNQASLRAMLYSLFETIRSNTTRYPKIHLLGCTQVDLMMSGKYTSCDSTSWQSGVIFDKVLVFDGKRMVQASQYSKAYREFRDSNTPRLVAGYRSFERLSGFKMAEAAYWIDAGLQAHSFKRLEKYVNKQFYSGIQ